MAQPAKAPTPGFSNEVTIDENGNVTGKVLINNSGNVKFDVSKYKTGKNQCIVTITSANVTWGTTPDANGGTVVVGS